MAESGSGCLQGTRSVEMLDWSLVLDGFRGPWLGSLLSAHCEQHYQNAIPIPIRNSFVSKPGSR